MRLQKRAATFFQTFYRYLNSAVRQTVSIERFVTLEVPAFV